MKLIFGLIACILSCVPSKETSYADSVKSWKYLYKGQLSSEIPSLKQQHAAMGLKCEVNIHKRFNNEYLMDIQKVRVAKVNQAARGPVTRRLRPLKYDTDDFFSEQLVKPIKFQRSNGIVRIVKVDVKDKIWSINVKKAIISLLSVDNSKIGQFFTFPNFTASQNPNEYQQTFYNYEAGLGGTCEAMYQLYPSGQGPISTEELQKTTLIHGIKNNMNDFLQVSKMLNFDRCHQRSIIVDSNPSVTYCKDCGANDQHKFAESDKTIYLINSRSYLITKSHRESEIIIPKMGKHIAVLSSTQELTLLRTSTQSTYKQKSFKEDYEVTSLQYTLPLSFRHSMGFESDANEDFKSIMEKDFWAQQNIGLNEHLKTSEKERKEFINEAKNILKIISEHLTNEDKFEVKPELESSMWKFTYVLSRLNLFDLEELYKQITDMADYSAERKQIERKLYLDGVSMAGTLTSVRFLKALVESGNLKALEAAEIFSGLQETISIIDKETIDELLKMCHSSTVRSHQLLHSSVCINVGQLIEKSCMTPQKVYLKSATLVPKFCRPKWLLNIVQKLSVNLHAVPEQQKAVYIQALAHTGTKYALQYIKPYILQMKWNEVLRSSAISSLRYIAKYYPREVLNIVLPVYQNRYESEVIRIAAAAIIFATHPPYVVLEKMAVDLWHEPNTQVGSFVYTSLESFSNATVPCFYSMSVNATKAVKLAKPFRLDWTSSYRKIVALQDLTKHMNILTDIEFVSSKYSGLPKYASTKISTTNPGNLLDKIFEARLQHNGIERKLLMKLFGSKSFDELPEYIRSILQKMKINLPNQERMEAAFTGKLFERTLFAYINEENYDSHFNYVKIMLESLREQLKTNLTTCFVKFMLPSRTAIVAPTYMGLPMTFFRSTELVVALNLKNVRLDMDAKLNHVSLSGNFKPYFCSDMTEVLGFYVPTEFKLYSAGHIDRTLMNFPVQLKLKLDREAGTLVKSYKPSISGFHFFHMTNPFTLIYPLKLGKDDEVHNPLIVNPQRIKYDKIIGKDVFGLGLHFSGYSENPWSLSTNAWFKQMICPNELPGSFLKLMTNPWLYEREMHVRLERGSHPTFEIVSVTHFKKFTSTSRIELFGDRRIATIRKQMKEYFENTQNTVNETCQESDETPNIYYVNSQLLFKGPKERKLSGELIVRPTSDNSWLYVYINKTSFYPKDSDETEICVGAETRRTDFSANSKQCEQSRIPLRFYKVLIKYGGQCNSEKFIDVEGSTTKSVKKITLLPQPDRAIAHEVKRICRKQQESVPSPPISESGKLNGSPSKTCALALKGMASINRVKFNVNVNGVNIDATSPIEYAKYMLYPYMDLTSNEPEEVLADGNGEFYFQNIQGVDVTSLRVVQPKVTYTFENVHHRCPLVNYFLSVPIRLNSMFRFFPSDYPSPSSSYCGIFDTRVTTFDKVTYSFVPKPNCEYVVTKDVSPFQHYIITVTESSESIRHKMVKVVIGSKLVEIIRGRKSSVIDRNIVVRVDDAEIPLVKGEYSFEADDVTVKIKQTYDESRASRVVNVEAESIGLRVETDGITVSVKVPATSRGQLIGLCGDNDGDKTSEYTGLSGTVYTEPIHFVNSYRLSSERCPAVTLPLQNYGADVLKNSK
ncbi:Uncharacterised protein g7549 [Pycnogonum litorale]